MIAAAGNIYSATNLHKNVSKKEEGQQLNELPLSYGLRGLVEQRNYHIRGIVFPNFGDFSGLVHLIVKEKYLATGHTLYSNLWHKVYRVHES